MKWPRTLDEWRALDARVKHAFDEWQPVKLPPMPEAQLEAWLMAQLLFAVSLPLLATPLLMLILYPSIRMQGAGAYYQMGTAGVAMALLAWHRYKHPIDATEEAEVKPS